ncbi:uncharacterized protein OCT59_010609 [Rhizophagus irregularis]|nr:hypothetical protein OCT59_010609 [Rhizophagus irregularis]
MLETLYVKCLSVESKTISVEPLSLLEAQVEASDYNTGKRNFDLTAEVINSIKDMREYLNETAECLRKVRSKLKDYELNMNKVKANLGKAEYEITNESLQHLKLL